MKKNKKHIINTEPAEANLFSYRKYAFTQFKKNKPAWYASWLLCLIIFIALFASFIANDQPIYAKYRGKNFYPVFSQHWLIKSIFNTNAVDSTINPETGYWEKIQFDITDWRTLELEKVIWAPIPYSPHKQDIYNNDFASPRSKQYMKNAQGKIVESPWFFRHHLGTDALGRDVLSGLIHGTKVSLLVGFFSVIIAAIIGVFLGSMAGYFGDNRIKISRASFWFSVLGIIPAYFYAFHVRRFVIADAFADKIWWGCVQLLFSLFIFCAIVYLFYKAGTLLKNRFFAKQVSLPVDSIVSRSIELLNSLPRLILIITVSAIIKERSLLILVIIIGFTSWTEIARFVRAELLKVRVLDYITAAKASGLSNRQIILKHALPNALAPVFVTVAFGMASAILIESGLSFLGIGVPEEMVTWGSMLNAGRQEFDAWWMIVFPGMAIFITITIYNLIGEGLRDALDPKLKN